MNYNVYPQFNSYNHPPPNYNNYNQLPPNYNYYSQPPPIFNNYSQPPPIFNNYNQPPSIFNNYNQPPPNCNIYNQPPPNFNNYNFNHPPPRVDGSIVKEVIGRALSANEENEKIIERNAMYHSNQPIPTTDEGLIEYEPDGLQKKCIACAEKYESNANCLVPNFCVPCGRALMHGEGMKHKIVSTARCKICDAMFATHYALNQHQIEFNHRFNCRKCGQPFYKKRLLIQHLENCKKKKNKKKKKKCKRQGKEDEDDVVFVGEFNPHESAPVEDIKCERSTEPQPSRFSIDWETSANMNRSTNEPITDERMERSHGSRSSGTEGNGRKYNNQGSSTVSQTALEPRQAPTKRSTKYLPNRSSPRSKKKPKSKATKKSKSTNKSGLQETGGTRRTGKIDNNELSTLICNCCSKKFDNKHGLQMHKMLVQGSVKCEACGVTFDTKTLYNQHACMFGGHVASDRVANIWMSERNREWTPGKNLVWFAPNKSFVPGRNRVWVKGQNDTNNTNGQT